MFRGDGLGRRGILAKGVGQNVIARVLRIVDGEDVGVGLRGVGWGKIWLSHGW